MTPRYQHYLHDVVFLGQLGRDDLYFAFGLNRGYAVAIRQNGFAYFSYVSLERAYQMGLPIAERAYQMGLIR